MKIAAVSKGHDKLQKRIGENMIVEKEEDENLMKCIFLKMVFIGESFR